jgi:AAHS family 4-hydroxybenzoate transporter-like MFS transporter
MATNDAQSAPVFDVTRAIDGGSWGSYQKRLLALAACAFAADGMANMVLGLAIPALVADWGAPREAFAAVAGAGLVGVTVGAACGGVLGDRFGRRTALIWAVALFGAMTAASAFVPGMSGLLLARLLGGLGIGGAIPNGAALIAEFTPARHRSLAIAIGMVFIAIGALLVGLIGTLVLPTLGWRGLFLITGVLPLLLLIVVLVWLPESPAFLVRRPERRAELLRLLGRCGHDARPNSTFVQEGPPHGRTALGALLREGMLGNTLLLWIAFFFCLLASYSMFSWIPTMLAGQGFALATTSLGMTAFNLGGVVGGVAGGWLIGRQGSRKSVLVLGIGEVVGALVLRVFPLSPSSGVALMLGALVVEGFFVAGLQNAVYTLSASIYPPFARATGVGTAAAVGRIGAVVSSYVGVFALQFGGASGYFLVIAGAAAIATAAMAIMGAQVPGAAVPVERSREVAGGVSG